ncbi:MAG: hypothetical protein HC790_02310 [Acaryochloridaceae cyanobacterium CSU_3_4]|nr:hypothetical protein [Acaryochloridaceae cyanobacterium CSU_3_4]
MNGLPNDIQKMLAHAAVQTEQFLDEVTDALDQTLIEVEQSLDDLFSPLVADLWAFEHTVEELAYPLSQRINPLLDQQPACIGCHHYHGKTYGDSFLVCAMHPYGSSMSSCPDWESC